MNDTLKDIETRIAALSGDLQASHDKVKRGEAVELTALQSKVGAISVDVVKARPDSVCFVPSLKQLVAQLDDLAVALKQQHRDKAG